MDNWPGHHTGLLPLGWSNGSDSSVSRIHKALICVNYAVANLANNPVPITQAAT